MSDSNFGNQLHLLIVAEYLGSGGKSQIEIINELTNALSRVLAAMVKNDSESSDAALSLIHDRIDVVYTAAKNQIKEFREATRK